MTYLQLWNDSNMDTLPGHVADICLLFNKLPPLSKCVIKQFTKCFRSHSAWFSIPQQFHVSFCACKTSSLVKFVFLEALSLTFEGSFHSVMPYTDKIYGITNKIFVLG